MNDVKGVRFMKLFRRFTAVLAATACLLLCCACQSPAAPTTETTIGTQSTALLDTIRYDAEIVVFLNENTFLKHDKTPLNDFITHMEQNFRTNLGNQSDAVYQEFLIALDATLDQFYQVLTQYAAASDGKLSYRFVDLSEESYTAHEVENGTVLFLCGDRVGSISIIETMSAEMDYETMDATFYSSAERLLAQNLIAVGAFGSQNAALLVGHDEDEQATAQLKTTMENNACFLQETDITTGDSPSDDVRVMLIVAPSEDYTEEEIARLREWVAADRQLIVFWRAASLLPNLNTFLQETYAVSMTDNVVCETDVKQMYQGDVNAVYADVADSIDTDGSIDRVMMSMVGEMRLGETATAVVTAGETAKVMSVESVLALGEDIDSDDIYDLMLPADSYPIAVAAISEGAGGAAVFGSAHWMYKGALAINDADNEALYLAVWQALTDSSIYELPSMMRLGAA